MDRYQIWIEVPEMYSSESMKGLTGLERNE